MPKPQPNRKGSYRNYLQQAAREVNQFTATAESGWEFEVVKHMLTTLQVDSQTRDRIYRFGERETGKPRLTLGGFLREVPFPYYLETTLLKNASHRCQLGAIFAKPNDREFVSRYAEALQSCPDGRSVVLICKWPYLPHGMAVHQLEPPEGYTHLLLAGRHPVVLEPWLQLLRRTSC